jgi:hypothetical protein
VLIALQRPVRSRRKPATASHAQGEVETWLAPLLARATRLGPWAMLRYQFTHREGTLMLTLTYSVILVILMIATGMLDKVLPVLGRL